ncbi:MAG TPA: hypothetical protein VFA44_13015 [Gaiellaceae bacterium]|nr:hypothetical protein [Gaiellaceae bacterium]
MLSTRMWRDPFFSSFGVFDDLFGRTFGVTGGGAQTWSPPVDVRATDEHYLVLVDPPGIVVADFRDGVLELPVPKPAEREPKKIAIAGSEKKELRQTVAA